MKKFSVLLLLVVLFSCNKESKDDRVKNIARFLDGQSKYYKLNGSVLVAEKGNVIYKECFGLANFGENKTLNDSSMFELASISKQFTATAIMLLKEGGKLKLADSLRLFFPNLPYSGVTIHHMLTHTSGLPDYESTMARKWDKSKIAFNNDVINFLATEKPQAHFKPGTRWEYSNTAFVLLASIVEKVSGESFGDFMSKNVFQPLEMTNSRVYNTRRSGEVIENYAYGYIWSDSLEVFLLPDSIPETKVVYWLDGIQGDGVVNSTAVDLLKWDRAIVNHTLLSESAIKDMTSNHALVDTASRHYYGYGVVVGSNQFGNFVTHSGGWPGYSTNLSRYIDGDRTIIVLSNNQSAATAISASIANILFGVPVRTAYSHKPIVVDSVAADSFVGTYKIKNSEVRIIREKEKLFRVYPGGGRVALHPESTSALYQDDGYDVQYEIEKTDDGQTKYYRIFYGVREQLERVN